MRRKQHLRRRRLAAPSWRTPGTSTRRCRECQLQGWLGWAGIVAVTGRQSKCSEWAAKWAIVYLRFCELPGALAHVWPFRPEISLHIVLPAEACEGAAILR